MTLWNSADDVLDFAIRREEEAATFYTELAQQMTSAPVRAALEDFAREERAHQAKLEGVKASGRLEPAQEKVQDLKIADYLVDVEPDSNMDYQQALIFAMKAEKAAFRLYTDLAAATEDPELRELLQLLAQEEAKHKLRCEVEYDEDVLREN